MYKIRFLSNLLLLRKYWFELSDILKGTPISLKELKKIKVPNDIAKNVEVMAICCGLNFGYFVTTNVEVALLLSITLKCCYFISKMINY